MSSESAVEYSKSIPFMERPAALDGTYAGDVGFDPLKFAKDDKWLFNYREAEIKHSRLAMLAAAGWPLSELFDTKLAAKFELPAILDATGRAPSPISGGLEKVSPYYWVFCVLLASAVDLYGLTIVNNKDYTPGDLGLDPLGLKSTNKYDFFATAEIKHGRLAMLAVLSYVFIEYVQGTAVVSSFYLFFPKVEKVAEIIIEEIPKIDPIKAFYSGIL